MILLQILFFFGLAYLFLAVTWLSILTTASWFFTTKKVTDSPLLHLGVIIPAHNEEDGIASTIASIQQCNYEQDLLKIIVLADNCTDNTATAARQAGALCLERTDPDQRGKGQALDWFLKTQRDHYQDVDGLSFVDADVCCHPDLFRELSASLSHPEVQVVQGFNGVANPLVNWRTALITAAFNVFNHLRMAANNKLFGTAMLKGLGMAFETSVLTKYGWPAHSVVEDVEFSLLLLDEKINIHYNPAAIITSEMATTKTQADGQRSRWEGGRFQLAVKLLPALGTRVIKGEFRFLHAFMDLFVLPLALLVIILFLWIGLAFWLAPSTLPVLLGLLVLILFYVASGQLQRRMGVKHWLYLSAAPLFIFWKLLLYAKMLLPKNRNGGWQRTKRNSELDK